MLLSYYELVELVGQGVIEGAKHEAINAASIDIHLGTSVQIECGNEYGKVIDYTERQRPSMYAMEVGPEGIVIQPGQFILAQSKEVFNLPNHISAEYKLKSSMARIGLGAYERWLV